MVQLMAGAIDLSPRVFALAVIHAGVGNPPAGSVHNRHHHLQIAQQGGRRRGARRRFQLPLRFEKQIWLVENAFANQRRGVAPGGIQLPGLPRVAAMFGERRGHPLAILKADARHRHEKLHGQVRRDLALAHLLLDRFREKFDQRQPPRHPTHAAIKPSRQLLETIAEALLQFRQQPALLQRGLMRREAQRAVQHQRFGLAHRPDHRFHRVPAQLLERRDALVAVDDQVTVGLIGAGHHYDRRLLARFSQRGQQSPLPGWMADSQMLKAPIELVKFQWHRALASKTQYGAGGIWSFAAGGGTVLETLFGSTRYAWNWSFPD
jgi:hypothetical protein